MATCAFALWPVTFSAADPLTSAGLPLGLGSCYAPVQPFEYKLSKSDPLYDTARDEYQRYLEELEDYVNCLERERSAALFELDASFKLFRKNFGRDGVFKETFKGRP